MNNQLPYVGDTFISYAQLEKTKLAKSSLELKSIPVEQENAGFAHNSRDFTGTSSMLGFKLKCLHPFFDSLVDHTDVQA
jgi:hypothetical protein